MKVQIGDLNVNYSVAGDGYPLVLVHGARSNSSHFEDMAAELSKSFRVYTYDLRGFGQTQRSAQTVLSHASWQADLSAFLAHFTWKGLRSSDGLSVRA